MLWKCHLEKDHEHQSGKMHKLWNPVTLPPQQYQQQGG